FKVLGLYLSRFPGMKPAVPLALTSVEPSQLAAWQRLTEGPGLAALNTGQDCAPRAPAAHAGIAAHLERIDSHRYRLPRPTPHAPEALAGIAEHVEQDDRQRYLLLRLSRPGPGIALIGSYGVGNSTNVSMTFYFYGGDAALRAASSEPVW